MRPHSPFVSPYWSFLAAKDIAKGGVIRPEHFVGLALISLAPINLKQNDVVIIDIQRN